MALQNPKRHLQWHCNQKRKRGDKVIDLKAIRTEKGLTQEQLAEKIQVRRQTVSNIEIGIANPSVPTAKKIGDVLEFDWTEFYKE